MTLTPETVFSLSSSIAMLGWLYLIVAARWTPRPFAMVRLAVPLALSVVYAASLLIAAPDWQGGFGSLQDVRLLFSNDWALTAGWVHYLAFDFFVGCWILSRAKERQDPHWLVVPCLVFTFLFGPVGFALYLGLRWARPRFTSISKPQSRPPEP